MESAARDLNTNVQSMKRNQERLPQSSKLLLRIRNPNKVFEDHLSIRNSLVGKGVGIFAERIFYKGAVVSLYLGLPVWISKTLGGNIPEVKHVVDQVAEHGGLLKFISADYLVPVRDLFGRYYVVCNSCEIPKRRGTSANGEEGNGNDESEKDGPFAALFDLYFGAHFMEFEEGGDANAELLEDGSVVAVKQIDHNTEIILRRKALRSEEEVMEEMAMAADSVEVSSEESETETVRPAVRAAKSKVKAESRKFVFWNSGSMS